MPEALLRRFQHFRQQSTTGTQVPQTLRRAVLDAVDRGVSMQALRRELGVTSKQVQSWRQRDSAAAKAVAPAAGRLPSPRVFEVADPPLSAEPAVAHEGGSSAAASEALELRLGGWSLVIRPIGRG
ncbi:MAG: hypothetical protein OEZ06_07360 [Myxococcales bacterium]|nr:hypothetical protein [Myxococcales bacterium]